MVIKDLPLKQLEDWPRNYRKHPADQIKRLIDSLKRNGQRKAVVVQESTDRIIAGHGVVEAARSLAWDTIRCDVWDVTDEQAEAFLVDDNELQRFVADDEELLGSLLSDLQDTEFPALAYDPVDIEAMIGAQSDLEDPGAGEPPEEPTTRRGDLWQCGEHRVLCGDCTVADDVGQLMDGNVVSAVLTDPPYQADRGIEGDDLGDDDFAQLHRAFVGILPAAEECTLLSFHSPRTFPVLLDAMRGADWAFERMLWLYKDNDNTYPWHHWLMKGESLLIFTLGGGAWSGDNEPYRHDTYRLRWGIGKDAKLGDERIEENFLVIQQVSVESPHPTVKSEIICQDLLRPIGHEAVYDPFLGSGTTMIAAEKLGRRCYGIEIEPRYVDVSIRRWEEMTGQKAELINEGDA